MSPACYGQRLLNPFRGVMNCIEYQGAEAVTTDGLRWDIYVRDTDLVEDLDNPHRVQTSDIRYGSWSPRQGLKRGAIYPSDDFKLLEERGAVVYEYLLTHHDAIPFPLRDVYEWWLLDAAGAPMALLDSAVGAQAIEPDGRIEWRAGRECAQQFRSDAAAGTADAATAAERLSALVNAYAGPQPVAQWFQRHADGSGTLLNLRQGEPEASARRLPASAFDAFLLRLPGAAPPEHQRLIADFHAWQSPCLLLLPTLSERTRAHLEQQALTRAPALERHHRLYPQIIDQEAIRGARVEALLRAGGDAGDDEDETMATYYIELNVTRTN